MILSYFTGKKFNMIIFDKNFNLIKQKESGNFSINIFKREILDEIKLIAIKLSNDFPNFVRVDLYIFHNKIYLSELTFDSQQGIPIFTNMQSFNDEIIKWKRIE